VNSAGAKRSWTFPVLLAALILSACTSGTGSGTTVDRGIDSGDLSEMRAAIWVDPNGCDHWIIDDGVEGYMTPRLSPDGRPVCREGAVPGTVTGEFVPVLIGRN